MPQLPKPLSSRRATPKANIKAPKFLSDLYADLRDRRLLPLVALLLVAIVAAPILLRDKGESEIAAPPITAGPEVPTNHASFAVVPADSGLRDYRKRLGQRQARDPFKQPGANQAATSAAGSGAAGGAGGATGGSETAFEPEGSSGSSSSSEIPSESLEPPNEGSSGGSNGGNAGASGNESKSNGSSNPPAPVVVEKEITGYVIDAKTGFIGKRGMQTGIEEMTKLPSAKQPIAVYLGASKDKKGALFLLGSLVTAYYGQGICTLDKQSCSVLELRPGKSATLAYGFEEERYKITLEQIRPDVQTSKTEPAGTESASH